MLNIIKSDLYRIFKGKIIYIAIILILVMAGFSTFTMSPGYIGVATGEDDKASQEMSEEQLKVAKELEGVDDIIQMRKVIKDNLTYGVDKEIIGANSNLYYIFIAIVFVVICSDLSNSTVKNTLSSAISRKKYYLSKLFTVLLLGTAIMLINNYFIYFLNLAINGKQLSAGFMEFTKCVVIQYPIILGMLGILVSLAFITKKKSTFNSISIPLLIVVQLILMAMIVLFKIESSVLDWELQNILTNLVKNPETEYIIKTSLLGCVYFVGANLLGYQLFKKTEIK